MFSKVLLLLGVALAVSATGCAKMVAPRDGDIGGTLGGGHARPPVSDEFRDGATQDSTTRIGGTLGSGH
jgi:xanthine/CO dehydrogenase XdhC/CoxF family maturation factor